MLYKERERELRMGFCFFYFNFCNYINIINAIKWLNRYITLVIIELLLIKHAYTLT